MSNSFPYLTVSCTACSTYLLKRPSNYEKDYKIVTILEKTLFRYFEKILEQTVLYILEKFIASVGNSFLSFS